MIGIVASIAFIARFARLDAVGYAIKRIAPHIARVEAPSLSGNKAMQAGVTLPCHPVRRVDIEV